MREDLLFHITTQHEWKDSKTNGRYEPKSVETEGIIHCSTGSQLEETANRLFKDEDRILLLVIDVTMIRDQIKYEKDEELNEKFPHINGPLSINAVIDKIEIQAEDDGTFNISFTSE